MDCNTINICELVGHCAGIDVFVGEWVGFDRDR